MKSQEEKYAELIMSLSQDFLLKKIDLSHYVNTLDMINTNFQNMHFQDNQRIAEEQTEI